MKTVTGWLGFFFCEIAFRTWDDMYDTPYEEYKLTEQNVIVWFATACYELGNWFYSLGYK